MSARADITIYHRLGDLNNRLHFLVVLEVRNPQPRCWRVWFLWGFSPRLAVVCLLPGFSGTLSSVSYLLVYSVPISYFSILLYSSYKDTSQIELTSHLPQFEKYVVAQTVSACNAGDLVSIPELGRSPGEGNGNPLQYSSLQNYMDRGVS